jgi:hypothetical protein
MKRRGPDTIDLEKVGPNTPLRLNIAAAVAYPDGSMTASGLRKERDRGRLIIERTAGKDYTTLAYIERMRELCREERQPKNAKPERGHRVDTAKALEVAQRTIRAQLHRPRKAK